MKAIRIDAIGGPEVLRLVDVPTPEPKADEVLIRVERCGVNFADIMVRRGIYVDQPDLPAFPGFEVSGVVEKSADSSGRIKAGDRVAALCARGGYAEYAVAPTMLTYQLPETVDFDQAATLPISGMTAWHLSHTLAPVSVGQCAVVYAAAGGVGATLCRLLKYRGAKVVALVGSDEKKKHAEDSGADEVINYARESVPTRVLEITKSRGADVIYNSVVGRTTSDDFKMIAALGTIVVYGMAAGPLEPKRLFTGLMKTFTKSPALRLYYLTSSITELPHKHKDGAKEMLQLMAGSQIRIPIFGTFPLREASRVHAMIEERKTAGKALLDPK